MKKLMNQEGHQHFKSTGIAFVILNKQSQAEELVYIFKRSLLRRIWNIIAIYIFRCHNKYIDKRWWEGHRIDIQRAAEPTDVFWENMSVTKCARFKFKLLAFLITASLLATAFFINYFLTSFSKYMDDEADKSNSEMSILILQCITLSKSIVLAVMNAILKKMMLKLTLLEKDGTFTQFYLSLAIKYFVVTAINTIVIPLATSGDKDTWFLEGGLTTEIFLNVILACFTLPIFQLFNVGIFLKKFKIWREHRKGEK